MADSTTAARGWRRWIHPLHSVRVRITLAAVVVTAVAVGAAGWLLVRSVEDEQLDELRSDINADLDELVGRLEQGDAPQEAVEAVDAATPLGFFEVRDEQGTLVAAAQTFVRGNQQYSVQLSEDQPVLAPDESPRGGTIVGGGGQPPPSPPDDADMTGTAVGLNGRVMALEVVTRPVDAPGGGLTVTAGVPVDQLSGTVDALRRSLTIGLPVLIALVAAIAWVLVGRALRPVEAIRAEVDEITGSTMHRRVPEPPTDDEIGRLAHTMNAMLGRLDTSATRQRQFVSDASHELRSPVAAIRTGLEVARRKADRADWPAVADTALAEEARLEALLDDLLLLAAQDESENGTTVARPTTADLAALTIAESQRTRRVPVDVVHAPANGQACVTTHASDQLARVVSNLVDNAARYATSAVQLTVSSDEDNVRVIVDDDGPGVPPGDRERIFERFTRLDDSRARRQGGSGLGLAVVRSVVTRHHGRAWVDDSPLGGARFVAELPRSRYVPSAVRPDAVPQR